jgi:hypothetical protein
MSDTVDFKPKTTQRKPVLLEDSTGSTITSETVISDTEERRIITPDEYDLIQPHPNASPAFLQGIRPLDPVEEMAKSPIRVQEMFKSSFALWSQFSGVEVDNRVFTFDDHRYLLPIYMCEEKDVVWIKSAQMGATIYEVLRLLWFCRYHTVKVALYFPTADGVNKMSKDRLGPIIASNPQLNKALKSQEDSLGLKQIENIHGKKSSLYMLYLGGTASKDSVPLDVLGFDEVRLVKQDDIDQAIERVSHSTYKYKMFVSTAGMPNCFAGHVKLLVRNKKTKAVTKIRFDELVDQYKKYQILSYTNRDGGNPTWSNILAAVCRGKRKMVKVTLWSGDEIVCTPDHRFVVGKNNFGGFKFQEIGKVSVQSLGGDNKQGIYCSSLLSPGFVKKIHKEKPNHWSEETCRVLGLFVSNGVLLKEYPGIHFYCDGEESSYVKDWAKSNNMYAKTTDTGVVLYCSRKSYYKLFTDCFSEDTWEKKIPDEILNSSPGQLERFLEGFFSTDGYGFGLDDPLCQKFDNKELLEQIRFMCHRVGISTSVTTNPSKTCHILRSPWCGTLTNFPYLNKIAVKSIEEVGDELAYDVQLVGDPWFMLADSGAVVHNSDIHKRFLHGTQLTWHVKCGGCLDGFVPSDCFPDCIVSHNNEVYLRCPKCKTRVHDTQNGNYVAHNPGGSYPSFHVSQFISKFMTVKEIWDFYNQTTNKKEFWNAKMGRPYIDEENVPITVDILENCINPDVKWLLNEEKKTRKNCAMGVDQHGGNVYVTILKRGHDGKRQLAHLEVVEASNPRYWQDGKPVSPFRRLYELMREFDVGMCICDHMPNYNEAVEFAHAFPARVFLAFYGETQKDVITWMDKLRMKESIKRGSKVIKLKWQCTLNRYASIDLSLSCFGKREIDIPHPDALVQTIEKDGRFEVQPVCRSKFFEHLKSIVRQKTIVDEKTGRFKMEWVYLGKDPHFVHSFNYAFFAYERLRRQAILIM